MKRHVWFCMLLHIPLLLSLPLPYHFLPFPVFLSPFNFHTLLFIPPSLLPSPFPSLSVFFISFAPLPSLLLLSPSSCPLSSYTLSLPRSAFIFLFAFSPYPILPLFLPSLPCLCRSFISISPPSSSRFFVTFHLPSISHFHSLTFTRHSFTPSLALPVSFPFSSLKNDELIMACFRFCSASALLRRFRYL